jgi:Helicase conserved C-terminal domain
LEGFSHLITRYLDFSEVNMVDHVFNRKKMIDALRAELVGPAPAGEERETSGDICFDSLAASYGPWRQKGSGEEILERDSPTKRYGVGVLFPLGSRLDLPLADTEGEVDGGDSILQDNNLEIESLDLADADGASDEFDLSLANAYQPSSFGLSFVTQLDPTAILVVEVTGGRYDKKLVTVNAQSGEIGTRTWWLRRPVSLKLEIDASRLLGVRHLVFPLNGTIEGAVSTLVNGEGIDLRVEILSRPQPGREEVRLLTVCIVNRTRLEGLASPSEFCLFQARFTAELLGSSGSAGILPYQRGEIANDREVMSLALLYRDTQTFATGHGCAADWDMSGRHDRACRVRAECLPAVEVPSITPEVWNSDGTSFAVPMASLAGLSEEEKADSYLEELIALYEEWIERRESEVAALPPHLQATAREHLGNCRRASSRMHQGLNYLRSDSNARRAFQLANHAVLLQQLITRDEPRDWFFDRKRNAFTFSEVYKEPDVKSARGDRGTWRPFQIAFLLGAIESAGSGISTDREVVDLIWFPTGGGKTEAYLGLAAFSMFKRRLDDPSDSGVQVLMRYTLRLLTAQQFQRACGLLCAMEFLRRRNIHALGSELFSAGIWLGGETTPNNRKVALDRLNSFERNPKEQNPFLLSRCPWCGAAFKGIDLGGKKGRVAVAFARQGETVILKCPDRACAFSEKLPIYVIDDDIYLLKPTLVLATIDKLARLAWVPEARSLFGLGPNGERVTSPPGLIIQDELHLISGPLGSLAGLYESVIEELCIDRRGGQPIPPKIVSSTATIRGYQEQIRSLYARDRVALFPPPGLSAADSFFASQAKDQAGRVYVGIHAVSLGSVQTEWVRTFSALLQAPMSLAAHERDPWWTIMVFFNSIREMGTAHTLFQSDIPDYDRVIGNRLNMKGKDRRYLKSIFELTGGIGEGEVSGAMDKLGKVYSGEGISAVDVCLASSIIEVGIDIPRLSLMVVAGQPKTTSQYIQVTGRVGRKQDRPALIVTMYSPSKPRDRSHFERFKSYHETLYAHVEPTSVTPFSPPALERALHAVLVSYSRQAGSEMTAKSPYPYPADLVHRFREIIEQRSRVVDPDETATAIRMLSQRAREWREWQRGQWSGDLQGEDIPLLRSAGSYATPEQRRLSWSIPSSMRNVDSECEARITTQYISGDDENA